MGKPHRVKPRCYWEHLEEPIWEHFENLRTFWELDVDLMRALWEHIGNKERKQKNHYSPSQKGKNWIIHKCMLSEHSHWLHELSISKTEGHHFWPGLIARAKNLGTKEK